MPTYIATRNKNLPNYKSAEVKFKDLEKAKKYIGKKGQVFSVEDGEKTLVFVTDSKEKKTTPKKVVIKTTPKSKK